MRDGARNLRGDGGQHSPDSPPSPTADAPPSPWPAGSVVRLDVSGGRVRVDAPAGWRSPELLRRELAAVRPELLRALAPELPPVDSWPASWCELFEERASIAAEASDVADPLAVAEADLRLAVWRGDVEALPVARAAG